MEIAQEKVKITTQEELDSFLFNYEPSEEVISIDITRSGNFTFDSKGKDVSSIVVCICGKANNSLTDKVNITFNSSPYGIKVYRNYTEVKVSSNETSHDSYVDVNSDHCSLDLKGIRVVKIFDSRTVDLSLNKLEMDTNSIYTEVIISGNSTVYICDNNMLRNAQVYLRDGSKLFIRSDWAIKDVNFCLDGRSKLEVVRVSYVTRVNLCAFDSSVFEVHSKYDMPEFNTQFFDNAHIVYKIIYYDNILDYCEKNNIEHTDTYGYFYKIVSKDKDGKLKAPQYSDYEYKVGTYAYPREGFDESSEECASGIHCSSLNWILRHYGNTKNATVLKLRVEFKDLAPYEVGRMPEKLRCKKAYVEKVVHPKDLGPRKMLLN